jgi:hypothetical protein
MEQAMSDKTIEEIDRWANQLLRDEGPDATMASAYREIARLCFMERDQLRGWRDYSERVKDELRQQRDQANATAADAKFQNDRLVGKLQDRRNDVQTLLWALQMVSVSLPHTDQMQELQNEVNIVIERFNQRATI